MRSRKPETKWFTEEKWHGVEKETKPKLKGMWEIAGIAKQQDDVLKETHVVFVMELTLVETRASIQNKNEHPFRHPNWRQHKMKRENLLIKRMKNQLTGKATFHVIGEIVPIPCVALSTLPFVKATFQKTGCRRSQSCFYRHVKSDETPDKKSKKDSAKGSVAMLKELAQMNCVSQPPKKLIWGKKDRGTDSKIEFSRCTWHNLKIWERKGPPLGIIQKCVSHVRSPRSKICGKVTKGYLTARTVRPQSRVHSGENVMQAQ